MTETYVKEEVAWRTMVKVPLSFFWGGETRPVGSSASLLELAPPWRHALVSGSHLDPKMTGNSGSGALSRLESVELELGSCCSDLDKQVSDEICRKWRRQFEIPFHLQAASCPRVTSCLIPPGRLSHKRRRTDRKDFHHVPHHHKH